MDGTRAQVTIVDETHPITRENILDEKVTITGRDGESKEVAIGDFATLEESEAPATIAHENSQKTVTITAEVADGTTTRCWPASFSRSWTVSSSPTATP